MAYYGRLTGHPVTIVMPCDMTEERKKRIKEFGAELILCAEGNFAEAKEIRDRISAERGYFNIDQFANPLNIKCHYYNTGQEIIRQIPVIADAFAAGVGTGGTLIGIGQSLRELNLSTHIAAVEPLESAVMSGGKPGKHQIQGIGDGFIPEIVRGSRNGLHELIDEAICISSKDALAAAQHIEREHHFCVGASSGANLLAAKKLAERFGTVVTIFPDSYDRYGSMGLKHCAEGKCPHEITRLT